MARRPWLSILSFLVVVFSISWMLALNRREINPIRGRNVLLVIAHPDDEVMFFGPTIVGVTNSSAANNVRVLCLSSGNAEGLGRIREQELVESLRYFGIQEVETVDNEKLQDGMTTRWPILLIRELVMQHVVKHSIDTIITFDTYGVSQHANHIAVSVACRELPLDVYTLHSVPLWRKYISVFDSITTFISRHPLNRVVYIARPTDTLLIQKAMRKGHKSQMLWFRWGWILFSRYLIINELDLIPKT